MEGKTAEFLRESAGSTLSLHVAGKESVFALINREDGITVICSLHQVEIALRYCDRIVGLANGRVVFDAATAGLSAADFDDIYGLAPVLQRPTRDPVEAAEPTPESALALG